VHLSVKRNFDVIKKRGMIKKKVVNVSEEPAAPNYRVLQTSGFYWTMRHHV